jgi:hypothetical protein
MLLFVRSGFVRLPGSGHTPGQQDSRKGRKAAPRLPAPSTARHKTFIHNHCRKLRDPQDFSILYLVLKPKSGTMFRQ